MGAAADGHVIIKTAADNSQLEKDLAAATKNVEALEGKLAGKRTERNQIAKQLKVANKEAIDAYNSVERLQKALAESRAVTSETGPNVGPLRYAEELEHQKQIEAELKEQEKILKQKEKVAERLAAKDAAAVAKLEEQTAELNRQKEAAGAITEQLRAQSITPVSNMMEGVEKRIEKIGKRISKLASRVFVFTMITTALRGMRTWLGNVIKTNDETTTAMARLKAALLTLAQPLVEVVVPAFTAFVNVLTRIITAAAGLVSMLFGKTIDQSKQAAESLNNEATSIEGVGSAAKKSSKSLASFDEINKLSSDSDTSGAGISAASAAPDFSFDTSGMEADFGKLLKWIELIGAALLAWKLSDNFSSGLKTFIGLILAINGAIELAKGTWDAWQNGVDWGNFLQMLEGVVLLVTGLGIAFGPVGAAIGLVVSGLVLLTTGFHDAMENGLNLQNMLMSITGIMAAGIGIGILTGSFIPALIAGIASLLLVLTKATGHGEELIGGIKKICEGFVEFITGVFSGDIEKALSGIEKIFEGLGTAAGAVIDSVKDTFLSFLDWLDEKTGGKFHGIIEVAKGFVTGFFDSLKNAALNIIDSVKQIFTGLVQFVSGVFTNDWDTAWKGVQNIFKGVWNGIVSLLESAVNLIIKGVNWLIAKLNTIHFEVPDWVPGIGGKSFGISIEPLQSIQLPRLAQGAVIPPNREFLAVLGDQKSGTNVESPVSEIEAAVARGIQKAGGYGGGDMTIILELDGQQFGKAVFKSYNQESRRVGVSLAGVRG